MPEVLPRLNDAGTPVSPPAPRSALFWDGTRWHVPRVDTHGRVQVRGENQLFCYSKPVVIRDQGIVSGADGYLDSSSPVDDRVWVITNVLAQDRTSPTTAHYHNEVRGAVIAAFHREVTAFAISELSEWHGHVYLEHDDVIQVAFIGSLVGDTCRITLTGYEFRKET